MESSQLPIALTLEWEDDALPALVVQRVTGRESISRLFEFTIDAVATGTVPPVAEFVGCTATLTFSRDGEKLRRMSGLIERAEEQFDFDPRVVAYRLHFAPLVHRLATVRKQDVYLDLSVPEIVLDKLKLIGIEPPACRLALLADYPAREFVVQWDETDLAFVSRLLEHVGVSYFFTQHDAGCTIAIGDSNAAFPPTHGLDGVVQFSQREGIPGIRALRVTSGEVPHLYMVSDYNYRTPNSEIAGSHLCVDGVGGVVEYGSHVKTQAEADRMARIRAEEAQARRQVYEGSSDICQLQAGHRIRIVGHERLEEVELLIEHVEHDAAQSVLLQDSGAGGGYRNTFRAVPLSDQSTYRPARVTPVPRIHGLLTGIIEPLEAGRVERLAHIDDQGRYAVRFCFDMGAFGQRKASHPVRKAEPTVGPDYGMHFPLRPGVEVVMAFVNGDPDRPVIVGGLHNTLSPAHVRAANASINTIKTASGIKMHFKDD